MKRWTIRVEFESETQPMRRWRGEVEAAALVPAVARALRLARRAHVRTGWASVVVLVEAPGVAVEHVSTRSRRPPGRGTFRPRGKGAAPLPVSLMEA
jgi:hypothetical protein